MPVRNLADADEPVTTIRAQICIVGAGMAAFALALKLGGAGRKIVVLESGAVDGDEATDTDLNRVFNSDGPYSRAETNRARGLGGTSRLWGGRLLPISDFQMKQRTFLGEPGWPVDPQGIERFGRDVEEIFGLAHGTYENDAFANEPGHFRTSGADIRNRWAKISRFGRRSLALSWKRMATQASVEILTNATVTRLDLDADTQRVDSVCAVAPNGKTVVVAAEHTVLASGAIECARLLLWTRQRLNRPAFGGPALGRYFQDHLRVEAGTIKRLDGPSSDASLNYRMRAGTLRGLHLELSDSAQEADGVYGAYAYPQMDLISQSLNPLRELAKERQTGRGADPGTILQLARQTVPVARSLVGLYLKGYLPSPLQVDFRLMVCVEQQPNFDNRIELSDSLDRYGVPQAKLVWGASEQDGRAFKSLVSRLDAFWVRSGLDRITALKWHEATEGSAASIAQLFRDAAHPSGLTRMGLSRAGSVVSSDLKLHDSPNLSIVSGSLFPTAGSANPTLTLMKLAMKHAEYLVKAHKL